MVIQPTDDDDDDGDERQNQDSINFRLQEAEEEEEEDLLGQTDGWMDVCVCDNYYSRRFNSMTSRGGVRFILVPSASRGCCHFADLCVDLCGDGGLCDLCRSLR